MQCLRYGCRKRGADAKKECEDMLKKMLALLLSLVMAVGLVTLPAYAETDGGSGEEAVNVNDGAARTEIEPNDETRLADTIYSGDTYSGNAGASGDVDFYKFSLTATSEISITAEADYNYLSLAVFDSTGSECLLTENVNVYSSIAGQYTGEIHYYLQAGTYYICVLSSSSKASDYTVAFTNLSSSGSGTTAPVITVQPKDVTASSGTAYFSVTATGSGLSYQWQMRSPSQVTWTNCTSGSAATSKLGVTVAASFNGYQFRCIVSNSKGTVYSDPATLTVGTGSDGTCGANLTWSLSEGVLTISGTGSMYNYDSGKAPWYSVRSSITMVVIRDGATAIGDAAFYSCSNITDCYIPQSVVSIGAYAFSGCKKLEYLDVPDSVRIIDNSAFEKCGVVSVDLGSGVESIGSYAFSDCDNLTDILIPASVTRLDAGAFSYCGGLKNVVFAGDAPAMGTSLFSSVKATCWYPGGNSTWTSAKKQNYGGTITWKVLPYVTVQPQDQAASSGYVYFTVETSSADVTYQWQFSSDDGATWTNTMLTGYNTSSLRVAANATNNGRLYRCKITAAGGKASFYSETARFTLGEQIKITLQPQDQVAESGYVYFTVRAEGDDLSYQWQWSADGTTWGNTSLTGCNTATLQVAVNATTNGRQYRCVITSKDKGSVTSNAAKLIKGTKAVVTVQPADQVGPSGYVYFTVTAKGEGLTYQWQWSADGKSWGNTSLTGYNTNSLKVGVSDTTNGRQYRCVITDKYGNTVTSDAAKLIKGNKLVVSVQPGDQVGPNGYVYFTVTAKGDNLKYQWQWSADGKTWGNTTLQGYNTNTLRVGVSATTDGRQYRCVITDKYGQTVTTAAAKLIKGDKVSITAQPEDQVGPSGYVYFTVTAKGDNLKYQWQWSADGKTWGNTSLTGCNTNSLKVGVSDTTNGRQYRCVVTDKYGSTVTSNAAKLIKGTLAAFTVQPADQHAPSGYVYFTVTAKGDGLTYQWQWSADGETWGNTSLTGYNTNKLRVGVSATTNGRQYRCVITDKYGNTVNSKAATLYKRNALAVTTQPVDQIAPSGYVYFTVAATGDGLKYQWQWSLDGKTWSKTTLTGYDTNTLRVGVSDTTNGRRYRCVITDEYGSSVNSEAATLHKRTTLAITVQPVSQVVPAGFVDVTVTAVGDGLTYQWQWSADGETWEDSTLTGFDTDTLRVAVNATTDGRLYRCIVSDKYGNTLTSEAAMIIKE